MKQALAISVVAIIIGLAAALGYFATHPTVKIERVYVAPSTTTTLVPNLPPGVTYQDVKASVLSALDNWWATNSTVGKGRPPYTQIECVLPNTWSPGDQFTCTTLDSGGSGDGTATVSIESPDPGQSFSILVNWSQN